MLKNYYQRGQSNIKPEYGLKAFFLLFCFSLLAFSSPSNGRQPEINELITPAAIEDVVYIRPFTLNEGYTHYWRQEQPFFKTGTLVVFKVNPDYVYPRNLAEPVLYAGNQTVQRLNHGHESGYVISIIPGELDLAKEPVWFGNPELPERVNKDVIENERVKAEKAEIRPFSEKKVLGVTQKHLEMTDLGALLRDHIAELVMKYSPQEKALAEAWRLPIARR